MSPPSPRDRSILIVGGGTFGTSTAYHLAQQGYTNVTVLDRWSQPSKEAAGNDINKIIRADYPEPLYANLATESIQQWRDPNGLFAGLYHRSGWLLAAGEKGLPFIEGSIRTAGERGFEKAQLLTSHEVRTRYPAYNGPMSGWKTYWNSSAGWANARSALARMADAAQARRVKYVTGTAGHVVRFLFDESGRCIGVKCVDGTQHFADENILAAGAAAASILDMKGQLVAKGHTVGHIQLEPHEVQKYAAMPVVDHLEGGILFPPQEDGIIKIGAVNFVTNYSASHPDTSLPRYRSDHPADTIPIPIERQLRNWMRELAPELAERPWVETRICWDADMPDYHFLISAHPEHPGLKLAVGGSAHGFKFLPVIGKYVVQMIEGTLDEESARKWKWRPGAKMAEGEIDPHPTPLLDLEDVPGWQETTRAKL
ncbi:fructosyl amino acid oxidase [Lecanosticta acicola]|uniref:Fructosyl amino acid oxidase n=1 Tax=Lecanosticta acicola TaxID=111012 RepID=A0AAI9E9Q5_9PEZI|nr:fructosyl amino acid oxidase [Lecanosticta acicola]